MLLLPNSYVSTVSVVTVCANNTDGCTLKVEEVASGSGALTNEDTTPTTDGIVIPGAVTVDTGDAGRWALSGSRAFED